ncbi:MAG: hypothetical protein F9K49_00100 [Caedimonadaceae bacterium]|nr:MAG: hypothetical protein F9K49_00100 [Caedimonadaceae bacterium]
MMTEEEKKKRIAEQELEDERNRRRLVIGGSILTSFKRLAKIQLLQQAAPIVCLRPMRCGYFNHATGTFSPYPPS